MFWIAALQLKPDLPRAWLAKQPGDADFDRLDRLQAASLNCSHKAVTPELVARVHAGGRRLLAWTVNEPERAVTLLDWGVDGLITDRLDVFAERFPALL